MNFLRGFCAWTKHAPVTFFFNFLKFVCDFSAGILRVDETRLAGFGGFVHFLKFVCDFSAGILRVDKTRLAGFGGFVHFLKFVCDFSAGILRVDKTRHYDRGGIFSFFEVRLRIFCGDFARGQNTFGGTGGVFCVC